MHLVLHVLLSYSILLNAVSGQKVMTGRSGHVASPRERSTYPNNVNETTEIRVTPGFRVRLYFTEFDLEDSYDPDKGGACVYDYLLIKDGDVELKKLCGNPRGYSLDSPRLGESIYSRGNTMTLNFVSDYSNEDPLPKGFKAHYKEVDVDECYEMRQKMKYTVEDWDKLIYCNQQCHNVPGTYFCSCYPGYVLHENKHTCTNDCKGKILLGDTGVIKSSNYPTSYSKLADCDWTIQAKKGISIELRFTGEFGIEEHVDEGCVYDWLQYELASGKKSQKYCGSELPNEGNWIVTNSYSVKVTFKSDLAIETTGFKLEYRVKRVRCSRKPVNPRNGRIVSKRKIYYEFEDIVEFECAKGYKMIGKSKMMCGHTGIWEDDEPKCQIKTCNRPSQLEKVVNGKIKDDVVSLTYGSTVTVWCYIWYEMTSGVSVWGCEDDEEWHPKSEVIAENEFGNVPECKPICGLKGNRNIREDSYDFGDVINATEDEEPLIVQQVIDGKKAKPGEWPWIVLVDLFHDGILANEICGGNLLTPKTVVTAAHCTAKAYKESILVHVGVTDRSAPEDIQVFSVAEVHQHINFTANLENDIAILILNASVTLGRYARPVCLPRSVREKSLPAMSLTNDPNFQSRGVIAGWGYTDFQVRKTSIKMMMTRLPIIENKQCNASIEHDTFLRKNMLCAGFIEGGRDSCQGDSGGPLMFKDNARGKWFMNGITSFGSSRRCGDKTYGIYTDVSKFIAWIESYMIE